MLGNSRPNTLEVHAPLMVINEQMRLRDIERSVILATLKSQQYNRTKTAQILGIGIRTLQRRLKEYDHMSEAS